MTRWAYLLGQPVAYSRSPALHNAAFAAAGVDARYAAREVAPSELAAAFADLRDAQCLGANITAPHKRAAFELVDNTTEAARALGVINTVVNMGGRLLGDNTDARGLARWMCQAGIDPHNKSALVLGAGGAARATVWALGHLGASDILVLNRSVERASALIQALHPHLPGVRLSCDVLECATRPTTKPWALVINATSLGHHGASPAVHPSCYSPQSVAVELVYNPPQTAFMRAAEVTGARVENGLGMLIHQAALAFECWITQPAPLEAYERAASA